MAQALSTFIPESNVRIQGLTGFVDGDYGNTEARFALALQDAGIGGGGGGTSAATIAQGINDSTDIDALLLDLASIETAVLNMDVDLGSSVSPVGEVSVIGQLRDINNKVAGTDATTFVEASGTATDVSAVASAANANSVELTIQNKETSDFLYVRLGSVASTTNSYTVPPLGVLSFDGLLAQQSLNVIADTGLTADYYSVRVNN